MQSPPGRTRSLAQGSYNFRPFCYVHELSSLTGSFGFPHRACQFRYKCQYIQYAQLPSRRRLDLAHHTALYYGVQKVGGFLNRPRRAKTRRLAQRNSTSECLKHPQGGSSHSGLLGGRRFEGQQPQRSMATTAKYFSEPPPEGVLD